MDGGGVKNEKNSLGDDGDDGGEGNDNGETPNKAKKLSGTSTLTRTPTPFKKKLAELRKMGSGSYEPTSPGRLVDDITELINDESKIDDNNEPAGQSKSVVDSVYETDVSSISNKDKKDGDNTKENSMPGKKVRKSLGSAWEMSDVPYLAETPVNSLK